MPTLRHILIYLALGGAAAYYVVIPFVAGLRRGPKPAEPADAPGAPMRPLRWITGIYGPFFVFYLVGVAVWATYGYLGGSRPGEVCVNTNPAYGGSGTPSAGIGAAPRHGAVLSQTTTVQACALHPGAGQWILFLLTWIPEIAFWGCVLLLTLRLIRQASRTGPFTTQAAGTMLLLGWVVIAGSLIVGGLRALGTDVLTHMLVTPALFPASSIVFDVLLRGPLEALLPVPALVGVALVTFSHITRVGSAMDEEIRATV
jgi:hypothetical protein